MPRAPATTPPASGSSDPGEAGQAGEDRARDVGARSGAREALVASALLVLLLGVGKPLAALVPLGGDVLFTLVAAFQLYVPLWLIQRRGEAPESHAIHAHGLLLGPVAAARAALVSAARRRRARGGRAWRRVLAHYGRGATFRPRPLLADLGRALLLALLVFPPFIAGHHAWQTFMAPAGAQVTFAWRVPPDLLAILVKNTILVALPEEMFYRGFVETRLDRLWPTRRTVLGFPLSRTVFVASAFFALGHFAGEWNPARLGPFFPAFAFSMLTRKSGSIAGAVVFHGMSNAFSAVLYGSTIIRPG